MSTQRPPSSPTRQRGAALLLAMIILTLITTIAASMVWQQWRAVQVEAAERARTQSAWILTGALDWARLILREDAKGTNNPVDHLGEPWAVPLAEARLSSFLAADKNNNADDGSGLDAFLSGSITDLQARYNLRNLVQEGKPKTDELGVLLKLCELAGVPQSTGQRIAEGLAAAWGGDPNAAVAPQSVDQLVWLGVDPAELKRLLPFVVLLPEPTTVNVNTAPREVISATTGVDVGSAERLVQMRQREPFKDMAAVHAQLALSPDDLQKVGSRVSLHSGYFEVQGQVRLGDRVLQERSIVRRPGGGGAVEVLRRERVNLLAGA